MPRTQLIDAAKAKLDDIKDFGRRLMAAGSLAAPPPPQQWRVREAACLCALRLVQLYSGEDVEEGSGSGGGGGGSGGSGGGGGRTVTAAEVALRRRLEALLREAEFFDDSPEVIGMRRRPPRPCRVAVQHLHAEHSAKGPTAACMRMRMRHLERSACARSASLTRPLNTDRCARNQPAAATALRLARALNAQLAAKGDVKLGELAGDGGVWRVRTLAATLRVGTPRQ